MFVCVCKEIVKEKICEIILNNPNITMKDILALDIGTQCARCLPEIKQILKSKKYGSANTG